MKKAVPAVLLGILILASPASGKVIQGWYTADCGVIKGVQEKVFIIKGEPAHPVSVTKTETRPEAKDQDPAGKQEKGKGKNYLEKVLWITACVLSRFVF